MIKLSELPIEDDQQSSGVMKLSELPVEDSQSFGTKAFGVVTGIIRGPGPGIVKEVESQGIFAQPQGGGVQDVIELGADIGLGTAGSIYGGQLGSAIGTAIAPGPGTVIGAFAGSIIGGMAGTAGSSVLTDYTDQLINDKDISTSEVIENMVDESKKSVVFDLATEAILSPFRNVKAFMKVGTKLIPEGTMRKIIEKSRPLTAIDNLTKRLKKIDDIVFDVGQKQIDVKKNYERVKRTAEIQTETIDKQVMETGEEFAKKVKTFQGQIDEIGVERARIIDTIVEPFNKSLSQANEKFKSLYTELKKVHGSNPVNLKDEILSLGRIVDDAGLDAFDTAAINKINKLRGLAGEISGIKPTKAIDESLDPGNILNSVMGVKRVKPRLANVSDAIEMKQDLYDISRSIFQKQGGSATKSGIGQEIRNMINSLDNKINAATGGQSSKINKAFNGYKTIQNINETVIKDFQGELGGEIGERLSEKELRRAFTGYFEKLSKIDGNSMKLVNEGKMSVSDFANKTMDKLYELPNALIYTGDADLMGAGNKMFTQLSELTDLAMSKSQLDMTIKDLVEMEKGVVSRLKGQKPDMKTIQRKFDDLQQPLTEQLNTARTQQRDIIKRIDDFKSKIGLSHESLAARSLGNTGANIAMSTGNMPVASGLRALGWMASIRQFTPAFNKMALDTIKKTRNLTLDSKMTIQEKRFVSKVLNHFESQYKERATQPLTE